MGHGSVGSILSAVMLNMSQSFVQLMVGGAMSMGQINPDDVTNCAVTLRLCWIGADHLTRCIDGNQ